MIAQLVSVAGTQVSALALPTIAVLVLHARPLAVSLLFAVSYAAQAVVVPFAGVLADSVRSLRRLLVTVDVLQAIVVVSIPVSRALALLTLPFLFSVAALSGGMGGITGIAIRAGAAQALAAADAVPGNAMITGARTVGQLTGPALAGLLIQTLGAVTAVAADAVSYLASALIFLRLPAAQTPRTADQAATAERARRRPLRESLSVLRARPALARIAIAGAALNLGGAALGALYVLYAFRSLRLSPATLGVIMVIQNSAAVLAVATATRVTRKIGLERVASAFAPAAAAALFLIPAASWLPPLITLAGYATIFGYCTTAWAIGSASLQQILTPPGQIGRVAALSASVGLVVIPAGAVAGGLLANVWGIQPTLLASAFTALAGTLTVVIRPATWQPAAGNSAPGARVTARRDTGVRPDEHPRPSHRTEPPDQASAETEAPGRAGLDWDPAAPASWPVRQAGCARQADVS